ncbi:MAG: hypothetical protein V5A46_11000 [Haloferacaceae archaeon]
MPGEREEPGPDGPNADGSDPDGPNADGSDPDGSSPNDGAGEVLPFDGPVLLYAAATASVAPNRVPELLVDGQRLLSPRLDAYCRRYECVLEEPDRALFLVPTGHWSEVGAELGVNDRESDALRRAHERQLRRVGADRGRRDEFEAALDIREAVVIGLS